MGHHTTLQLEARFQRSAEQLNQGDYDELLSRYDDNVTILIGGSKSNEADRGSLFFGKAGFRDCLFRYVALLNPLTFRTVIMDGPFRAVATFGCRNERTMTYEVEFSREGQGKRVHISLD